MGKVRTFLGIKVELPDEDGHRLDQQEAIEETLRQHGLANAKGVLSPIGDESYEEKLEQKVFLGERNGLSDPTVREFQSLVGSLLWVTRCMRPYKYGFSH
uniref:AlNc14C19G1950 protein n=1 Tax=Albugo laibachii Nc14 TaxID=890382 RepID=F0W4X9_9STRA|nr:AlNc14C19G1950 [Albugo laibachii Nc14]|eukprot:CCA16169.1 AlNc14C19G1950 [Albugo laibachii Nc14]